MTTWCENCDTKTHKIDASTYAGDYHSPPTPEDYAAGRQCVNCGAVYEAYRVGKIVRARLVRFANLPVRNRWEEPIL